jgi:hypothetical protein
MTTMTEAGAYSFAGFGISSVLRLPPLMKISRLSGEPRIGGFPAGALPGQTRSAPISPKRGVMPPV